MQRRTSRSVRVVNSAVLMGIGLFGAACSGSSQAANPDLSEGIVSGSNVLDYVESRRSSLERVQTINDSIGICMMAEGFEYVPDEEPPLEALDIAILDADMTEIDFATAWGFGLTTRSDFDSDEENQLTQDQIAEYEETANQGRYNPFEHMSPADADAYIRTFSGEEGCFMQAYADQRSNGIAFDDQREKVDEVLQRFAFSPEVTEFYKQWSSCMNDAGFEYPSPLALRINIEDRVKSADRSGDLSTITSSVRPFELEAAIATVSCGGTVRDLLPAGLSAAWLDYASDLK